MEDPVSIGWDMAVRPVGVEPSTRVGVDICGVVGG